MTAGIYTLANDPVLEWLIAFLNAAGRNAGDVPVCVIPYDDRIDAVRHEVAGRPGVTLFDDAAALARADDFARRVWALHPTAMRDWGTKFGPGTVHRLGMHRKLCALDGSFDRFVFLDADVLVLRPLDFLLEALGAADVAVYDDQYNGLSHVFDVERPRLRELFDDERLRTQVFCAGIFAARRGLFADADRERTLATLRDGDAEILYPWGPDQSLLNYMVLRLGRRVHNGYLALPPEARAETCVTCPRLEARDDALFDRGVALPFVHYIGVPITAFDAVRAGRNVVFPYRDFFLRYRWLHDPGARPALSGPPEPYWRPPGRVERWLRRLGLRG
jgi:hypothetical protein